MATSNNDRISSRRLLDVLKGLQESRHLGSEPEVVTETIEYPAKIRPIAGTYPNTEQGLLDMLSDSAIDVEHNLPVKVYGLITKDANGFTVPEKSGEPLATLDVVSNIEGLTIISDVEITSEMINNQPITGHYFMLNFNNLGYGCFYEKADLTNANTLHVWETTAYTETNTTKTKRTIKQDYVPNADWNQNDPDGDGYVEGRTHWVEKGLTDVIPSAGTYNSLEEFQDALNSVEPGVVYVCDEYNFANFPVTMPEYTSEPVAVLDKEFVVEGLRVLGPSDWDGDFNSSMPDYLFVFKTEPYFQANVVMNLTTNKNYRWKAIAEVAHKLDRKFYDYTPPVDTEPFVKHIETFTLYSTSSFAAIINGNEKDRIVEKYNINKNKNGVVYNDYFAIIDVPPYYALIGMDSNTSNSVGYYISPMLLVPKIALRRSGGKTPLYPLCDCRNMMFYFDDNANVITSTPAQLNKGIVPITSLNGNDTFIGTFNEYENSLLYDVYGVAIPMKYSGLFDGSDISLVSRPYVFEYGTYGASAKRRYGETENSDYIWLYCIDNTNLYSYLPYIKFDKYITNYVLSCKIVCKRNNVSTNHNDLTLIEKYLGSTIDGWSVVLPDGQKGVFQNHSVILEDNTTITTLPINATISSNTPFELPD